MNSELKIDVGGEVMYMTLSDGQTVRVIKHGQGLPLILIHTIRTQIEYFKEILPFLTENFTVYAVDLPGHGESSINKKLNYDEAYMRESMITLIHQLGLEDITLMGESIGATLSLTIAASIPDKVKQVFAVNTYDYEKRYADGIRRGNFMANFIMWNFSVPVHGAIFAAMENADVLGMVMSGGVTNIKKMPTDLVKLFVKTGKGPGYGYLARNVLTNWKSWAEAQKLYDQITCPVTLIYGENDWSRADERTKTLNKVSTADVITIPNSGHFLSVDNPKALQRVISTRI